MKDGLDNLRRHIRSAQQFGVPVVVTINRFAHDSDEEIALIQDACRELGVPAQPVNVWRDGGAGALDAAAEVLNACDSFDGRHTPLYEDDLAIEDKIDTVARRIYGAAEVQYTRKAMLDLKKINQLKLAHLPICMAKTQKSLTDNPKILGAPVDFPITINEVAISAGAGFVVPIAGSIMRMPGLARDPAAIHIDIDDQSQITGLF